MRPESGSKEDELQNVLNEPIPITEDSDIFDIAPHNYVNAVRILKQPENIIRNAQRGDYFRFMKNIGGGGAHHLTVKDFKVTVETVSKTTFKS